MNNQVNAMTQLQSKAPSAGSLLLTEKRESLWVDGLRRLMRNKASVVGGSIIVILVFAAVFANIIAPRSFENQVLNDQNKVPQWQVALFPVMAPYAKVSSDYFIGADYAGRDLFSRIIYGARISLMVAFIGPLISLIIGIIYGSISGYFGGRVDNVMMRVVDILYAFPTLLFIILLLAFFRSTMSDIQPGTFAYTVSQLANHGAPHTRTGTFDPREGVCRSRADDWRIQYAHYVPPHPAECNWSLDRG
jgi:oligopeptide transport system permease protein